MFKKKVILTIFLLILFFNKSTTANNIIIKPPKPYNSIGFGDFNPSKYQTQQNKDDKYYHNEYLKLKCKKLSDINYELRLYKKEATGESTFEVVIVLLSEKSANNKKLAKSEIKVLDYDV